MVTVGTANLYEQVFNLGASREELHSVFFEKFQGEVERVPGALCEEGGPDSSVRSAVVLRGSVTGVINHTHTATGTTRRLQAHKLKVSEARQTANCDHVSEAL